MSNTFVKAYIVVDTPTVVLAGVLLVVVVAIVVASVVAVFVVVVSGVYYRCVHTKGHCGRISC